jgi:hypothetical protein
LFLFQTVAQAAHRVNRKAGGLNSKALAQAVDVHIQCALVAGKVVAPDVVDQLPAAECPALKGCQRKQQFKLLVS